MKDYELIDIKISSGNSVDYMTIKVEPNLEEKEIFDRMIENFNPPPEFKLSPNKGMTMEIINKTYFQT